MRSLTRESFRLDDTPPTVTVQAAYSKHRREDVQPFRSELAKALRPFVNKAKAGQQVFPLPPDRRKAVAMFKADLKAAGILYKDKSGKFADFHALRHTFITNLAKGGVSPKVAMDLARHSDINLTMGRYSHTVLEGRAEALQRLPDLREKRQPSRSQRMQGGKPGNGATAPATEASDAPEILAEILASNLAGRGSPSGQRLSPSDRETDRTTEEHGDASRRGRETYVTQEHQMSSIGNGEGGIQGTPSHGDFKMPLSSAHKALILQRFTRPPLFASRLYHSPRKSANPLGDVHKMCTRLSGVERCTFGPPSITGYLMVPRRIGHTRRAQNLHKPGGEECLPTPSLPSHHRRIHRIPLVGN